MGWDRSIKREKAKNAFSNRIQSNQSFAVSILRESIDLTYMALRSLNRPGDKHRPGLMLANNPDYFFYIDASNL